MPSVDDLLNMAEVAEVTFTETNDKIEIDADTRTMIIPDTERIFGVMSDEKGERKYFRCKRFVGNGIDLSKLDLRVIYQNASGLESGKDKYIVTDLKTDGEDYVTFSWELSRKVTAYKGIISFIVCAIKTVTDGTITNEWNTTLANGEVLEGLEVDGTQEQEKEAYDYYKQLEAELLRIANEQKVEIEAKGKKTLESIPEDYTVLERNVDKLNEDLVDNGCMKKYQLVKGMGYVDIGIISAHTDIYFMPNSITEQNITGMNLYGWYGRKQADGYDTLAYNIPIGKKIKVTTNRKYEVLAVSTKPYSETNKGSFYCLSSNVKNVEYHIYKNTEDIAEVENEINLCNGKLPTLTSSSAIYNQSEQIENGDWIYFEPITCDSADVTGLTLIGMYGATVEDGYEPIARNIPFGTRVSLVASKRYHHLRVTTQPYKKATYTFSLVSTNKEILRECCCRLSVEKQDIMATLNRKTCKIFKKVVCCGDSYTSGHIQLKGESNASILNEDYSWVHYMATLTGNNWLNCGRSGANVWTWQTTDRGLPRARTLGKSQAYVIGLMINDVSTGVNHVDLGTIADVGTDNRTYYAGLSKIIRELASISPKAKIFVNTCPKTTEDYFEYNNAVREIVELYNGTYNVHCLDLSKYSYLYENSSLVNDMVNGHYTAIGYEQFAEIYEYILSEYINNHISEFQNVHEIECD